MSGLPINGTDLHRRRALELIGLADKTDDLAAAGEMLELAAQQLDLAEREVAAQQQQQPTSTDEALGTEPSPPR